MAPMRDLSNLRFQSVKHNTLGACLHTIGKTFTSILDKLFHYSCDEEKETFVSISLHQQQNDVHHENHLAYE